MMTTGDLGYDGLMHGDPMVHGGDKKAYYKVGYFMLVCLAVVMTILVSNLLISENRVCSPDFYLLFLSV